MIDRAEVVNDNFRQALKTLSFPSAHSSTSLDETELTPELVLNCFQSQVISRHLDFLARTLKQSNQSFYTIGSSGHEGNAAVAAVLQATDMAFLHYRSAAFFIQRMRQFSQDDPIKNIILSLKKAL